MSTYSSNLGTTLISTGDQSGVWGNTTNYNLGTLMEQAISSYVTQQFNNADVTLSILSGADAGGNTTPGTIYNAGTVSVPVSARNMYIECQGTSSGNNLIVPNNTKLYFIYNNITSGGGTITVKTGSGTGVAVPNGKRVAVVCNGTNVVQAENYFSTLTSPSVAVTGGSIDGATVGSTTASTVRGTTITATSQFTGPGTGLTGTASGLSIGGSAASATTATTATTATNLSGGSVAATSITASGSTVLGSPTGGSQGAGTLNAQAIYVNGLAVGSGNGSVTSVAMSVPAFLSVSGSPITTSGTFAVSLSGTALPILNGGTGATSASAALTNLGAPSVTGAGASGTWGINISGNAATVTNGLTTSNYNSYAPTLTGGGASGTWSINISGNAATVSNGVYTTGSYSNPSWLTSISGGIVSGNISGNAANITGTYSGSISSSQVTTALGYTPYNSSNPSGYITSSALSGYATQSYVTSQGYITSSASITGTASNITAYTINQSVGTGNSPTFAGLSINGDMTATGNITAYYSDDRLKTKLGVIENALDKVRSLEGFYYEANQTAQDLGYFVKREVGVSAQSVQSILPEVVKPAPIDKEYLTVQYERLVPLLIQAIKELEAKVEALSK